MHFHLPDLTPDQMELVNSLGKTAFKKLVEWLFRKAFDRKKDEPLTPAEKATVSQVVQATFAEIQQFDPKTRRVMDAARKRVAKKAPMAKQGVAVRKKKVLSKKMASPTRKRRRAKFGTRRRAVVI